MTCIDCNSSFDLLVMIPDHVWQAVAPENGEICLTCLEQRLRAKHFKRVFGALSYQSDVLVAVNSATVSHAVQATIDSDQRRLQLNEIIRLKKSLAAALGVDYWKDL